MRSALTSTAAGLAVTAIGVIALVALFGASPGEEPSAESIAGSSTTVVTTTLPATTTTDAEPVVVAVAAPTPDLDGVGDAVARVLYGSGYATHTAPDELAGELPPAVLALLIERDVTLTIATEAEPSELQDETP